MLSSIPTWKSGIHVFSPSAYLTLPCESPGGSLEGGTGVGTRSPSSTQGQVNSILIGLMYFGQTLAWATFSKTCKKFCLVFVSLINVLCSFFCSLLGVTLGFQLVMTGLWAYSRDKTMHTNHSYHLLQFSWHLLSVLGPLGQTPAP